MLGDYAPSGDEELRAVVKRAIESQDKEQLERLFMQGIEPCGVMKICSEI